MSSPSAVRRHVRQRSLWKRMWEYRWIYLMLLPSLAFFFIFRYMPMYGIQLAFKNYVLAGISASPWNNFEHFKFMLLEPGFLPALRNTLIISFMRIVIGFPFPIILALMIECAWNTWIHLSDSSNRCSGCNKSGYRYLRDI